ncbi:hypothetical protein BH10ACT7_BH10ACT7_20540 [soil metagenome]
MRKTFKDVVLSLAGLAGLSTVLWLLASSLLGIQLIIFQTGSMSPSMPTGTAALAIPVPADQIQVGDVITVPRPGAEIPVTHRVVSVELDPASTASRIIELQGDANETRDVDPYTVSTALRIVLPVPGFGTAIATARQPLFLGATTLVVAALIVWAFWPATPRATVLAARHTITAQPRLHEVKR